MHQKHQHSSVHDDKHQNEHQNKNEQPEFSIWNEQGGYQPRIVQSFYMTLRWNMNCSTTSTGYLYQEED